MQQLSGDLNYVLIWTGYQVLGNQESMASWNTFLWFWFVFMFVWVSDVCWLWGFCGVLLGVLSLFGRFFSVFLRAWVFGFLCLILGRLLSHETQESISVVWCKMTDTTVNTALLTQELPGGDNEFIRT